MGIGSGQIQNCTYWPWAEKNKTLFLRLVYTAIRFLSVKLTEYQLYRLSVFIFRGFGFIWDQSFKNSISQTRFSLSHCVLPGSVD